MGTPSDGSSERNTRKTGRPSPSGGDTPPWLPWFLIFLVLMSFVGVYYAPKQGEPVFEVPFSRFQALLEAGKVEEVTFRGADLEARLKVAEPLGPQGEQGTRLVSRVPPLEAQPLLGSLHDKGVTVRALPQQTPWRTLLIAWLPWILILGVWLWLMGRAYRNIGGGPLGGGDLKKFLQPTTGPAEVPKVRFADVAGQETAKREVRELVDYLKHPETFRRLGAEVPKGVLLMGPPGTGKTLLAKALAGEAGVPFFSMSASEFIEVFVGVGAARVRNLFEQAKKNAPSIIFIDEIDAVGRTRGTGLGGGHDEREQTLNQVLAEMDGFTGREAVIVIAATNRPDVLDPALLRPGRFDRHVTLDLPDVKDREAILRVHTRNKPLAEDVDLAVVARGTPGFSGADLKNLVNEAAILAARERCGKIAMRHFDQAKDKVTLGVERHLVIQEDERHRLAVHEGGHTAVGFYLPNADPVYKVTIIPRGQALGVTQQLPEVERHTLPEEYLRDRLAVMLGGRAAERLFLGSVSSGADDDIRQATRLARAMVSRWGMDERIGPVDLRESDEHPFLGKEMAQPRRYSELAAAAVDKAVQRLLREAEARAESVLQAHREAFLELVRRLEAQETLLADEIRACLAPDSGTGQGS